MDESKEITAPIALQLWTVRDEIEKDLNGTLERIAQIGYRAVETAFFPEDISIRNAADALKSAGLRVCSIHVEKPVGEEQGRILELADAYACNQVVWHGWPEDQRYKTQEGLEKIIEEFESYNSFALENGLELGLHNHWWEFEKWNSGEIPFEILLERLPNEVFFEIDTYWAKVAGQDPARVVGKFGDRARMLHIKDGPARFTPSLDVDEPEPMVAVGQGSQDFDSIVKKATGHVKWMIVELDNCETDSFKAVKESFEFLVNNNLAKA
jgi:sugar phosphate isomerase/epimerase